MVQSLEVNQERWNKYKKKNDFLLVLCKSCKHSWLLAVLVIWNTELMLLTLLLSRLVYVVAYILFEKYYRRFSWFGYDCSLEISDEFVTYKFTGFDGTQVLYSWKLTRGYYGFYDAKGDTIKADGYTYCRFISKDGECKDACHSFTYDDPGLIPKVFNGMEVLFGK